jgi:hypothetical protein
MKASLVVAATSILGASVPSLVRAHHSPAAYDVTKEVSYEGVVTRYVFANPHVYLTIETRKADGTPFSQVVEAGPISTIQPLGLERDSLKVGDPVTVRGNPNRRGEGRTMLGRYVTRADNVTLPLNIQSASVRPASTALATGMAGTWRPSLAAFEGLSSALSSWPLTPRGRAELTEARRANSTPHSDCVPAGAPMLMVYPVATTVTTGDEAVVFDIDWLGAQRTVRLVDAHPENLEPTLHGDSIGHWEGDVLVVDTIGFAPHAEGLGFGMPSSEQKHLVERFSVEPDRRHMRYEVTVTDPVYLVEPVRYSAQWEYSPGLPVSGAKCDLQIARQYLREAETP